MLASTQRHEIETVMENTNANVVKDNTSYERVFEPLFEAIWDKNRLPDNWTEEVIKKIHENVP